MPKDRIVILDFGSQYTHLIARRIREFKVYSEIVPYNITADSLKDMSPKGIILSGGPSSVFSNNSPVCDKGIFNLNIPVLGICYGVQLMSNILGGRAAKASAGEYGKTTLSIIDRSGIFKRLLPEQTVWMSHGDKITRLPSGFKKTASTANADIAAISNSKKKLFGVQFHPEVAHTPKGRVMLNNFVFDIAGCRKNWSMRSFANIAINRLKQEIGEEKVLCGLSGGVDSSVALSFPSPGLGVTQHLVLRSPDFPPP